MAGGGEGLEGTCPRALKWHPRPGSELPLHAGVLLGSKDVVSVGQKKCHWVEAVLFRNTLGMAGSELGDHESDHESRCLHQILKGRRPCLPAPDLDTSVGFPCDSPGKAHRTWMYEGSLHAHSNKGLGWGLWSPEKRSLAQCPRLGIASKKTASGQTGT